jgi:pimeloyl-ACP methyl ester carboxylesterase
MDEPDMAQSRVSGFPGIVFDEVGSGPPLIFLHGIGGNRTNWTQQQHHMADMCTTIAWDARGYGLSEDYEGPLQFSQFSDDLNRLLDFRRIDSAHFVGLSMGARILMNFFSSASDRVSTLTLCDCFYSFGAALSADKQAEFIALRQKPLRSGMTLGDIAPKLIESLVSPNCRSEVKARLHESILDLHVESYLKTVEASMSFDMSGELVDFDIPVQLIFGEHDRLTPPSIGRVMMKQMPNARLQVIKDAGHISNMEQPSDFNNILRSFLTPNLGMAKFQR